MIVEVPTTTRDVPPETEGGRVPSPGTVLAPGVHVVELEFGRPVPEPVLLDALARMAFEEVVLDRSSSDEVRRAGPPADLLITDLWTRWSEWGGEDRNTAHPTAVGPRPVRYRFVARLRTHLQTFDTPEVRWIFDHVVPGDLRVLSNVDEAEDIGRTGHGLVRGRTYALLFSTRMRSQPHRSEVCEALAIMGFRPFKMTLLKKNMRVRGLPGANVARWYGIARWEMADSVIVDSDPLFFEEVVDLDEGVKGSSHRGSRSASGQDVMRLPPLQVWAYYATDARRRRSVRKDRYLRTAAGALEDGGDLDKEAGEAALSWSFSAIHAMNRAVKDLLALPFVLRVECSRARAA